MKKSCAYIISIFLVSITCNAQQKNIDREALTKRNSPVVTSMDSLSSLSLGNGSFAFTADVTGLQTFPEFYSSGVPLGTQSHWGWHSFQNSEGYKFEETLENYDLGHEHTGMYSVQLPGKGRRQNAVNYFRSNPHRMHLGIVGLELVKSGDSNITPEDISGINQKLDIWNGRISSVFMVEGIPFKVTTVCHPEKDRIACKIESSLLSKNKAGVKFRFPYPTGMHTDDACDWGHPTAHTTEIIQQGDNFAVLKRSIDSTTYFVKISWEGQATLKEKSPHYYILVTQSDCLSFTVDFSPQPAFAGTETFRTVALLAQAHWKQFWRSGGVVDFSQCKDERAKELERRVVLSQYLTAIQCAATEPPQETGLTYNSWYGKFHLEMHWWHQAHFALWNRKELLTPSMEWYGEVESKARQIAERQSFEGVRWMKMTDPSGQEAPSSVGSFLIWQQPHFIYFAELIYRQDPTIETLKNYQHLVMETAKFMASFVTFDEAGDRYIIKGVIPAQETLRPAETVNPPFELSYWHFALSVAQKWRERAGMNRDPKWDDIINRLSRLASKDGLYLAAESAPQTYQDVRFTSDHMAVLCALGILPQSPLADPEIMRHTLVWVWENWNWDHTWGWDFPTVAMCAARLGEPEKAVSALLMDKRTNTYLANGHNYQNDQLRIYLPGNGGLLTAVAMMCAGWDGAPDIYAPGFPKNGKWDVKWEGLNKLP